MTTDIIDRLESAGFKFSPIEDVVRERQSFNEEETRARMQEHPEQFVALSCSPETTKALVDATNRRVNAFLAEHSTV